METKILIVVIIVGVLVLGVLGVIGYIAMQIDDLHTHIDQVGMDINNLERAVKYEHSHKQDRE